MVHLPDVYCWIKLIEQPSGTAQPDGVVIEAPRTVTVRYSVANDSHKPAGPLYVVGTLRRDGVKVTPNGRPNVVSGQPITVQPRQIWTWEYTVLWDTSGGPGSYEARLHADVGNLVHEEDEDNNRARMTFAYTAIPYSGTTRLAGERDSLV